MRKKYLIRYILIPLLLLNLNSCSMPSPLSPKETVKLYLDELAIFKDPIYRKASFDELERDPEKIKRYKKAVQTIKELLWTDSSSLWPERRKKLLLATGAMITYKGYRITSERIEDNKAFVTVILERTSLFNKDLGKASKQDSKPITYELRKTSKGWQIKDIGGILAKSGL